MCVSLNPEKLLTSRQLKKIPSFTLLNEFILLKSMYLFSNKPVLISGNLIEMLFWFPMYQINIYINNMAIYVNFIHLNIWHLCEIWSLRAYQNSLSFLPSLQLCQILISTIGKFWEILMCQSIQCVFCSAFT